MAGLLPKQIISCAQAVKRLNIWEGSVRSGKTFGSIARWVEYVGRYNDLGVLLMTGKTQKTLYRNIIQPMQFMYGSRRVQYNRGLNQVRICGKVVDCVGANDERAQDQIRGATVGGAYGDELTLWPESFFNMLLSRMSVKGAKFFGTTNPDSPYHWLKEKYLDREADLNLKSFRFRLEDNTTLDPAFVEAIKKEYVGLWYKRFIEGLWVMAEGAIYDAWDEARHVHDLAGLEHRHHFCAVDYGTNNAFACGLFGYQKRFPCDLVREYYFDGSRAMRRKTDAEYADDIAKWLDKAKPSTFYVDPSAASFIAEMRRRGYHVTEAANDVVDGIRFVAGMLANGSFRVDRRCENSRKEFTAYVWDSKAQARGEDKPLKINDHCMDMIRYGLYTHFQITQPAVIGGLNYA